MGLDNDVGRVDIDGATMCQDTLNKRTLIAYFHYFFTMTSFPLHMYCTQSLPRLQISRLIKRTCKIRKKKHRRIRKLFRLDHKIPNMISIIARHNYLKS